MPNRFDIFITRLETKSARESAPPHPMNDQHSVRRDKASGSSTAAPTATRVNTSTGTDTPSTAILMSR